MYTFNFFALYKYTKFLREKEKYREVVNAISWRDYQDRHMLPSLNSPSLPFQQCSLFDGDGGRGAELQVQSLVWEGQARQGSAGQELLPLSPLLKQVTLPVLWITDSGHFYSY